MIQNLVSNGERPEMGGLTGEAGSREDSMRCAGRFENMSDRERERQERLGFARSLVRASVAVRVIGILCGMGAILMIFVAQSVRSKSDQVGFTLIGLAVLLVAALVWATGVFHGSVGRTLPTLVAIDTKLDWIGELLARGVVAAPSVARAESHEVTAAAEQPASPVPAEPVTSPPVARVFVPQPEPELERTPCSHCGGLIHPEATLCVHCMKHVSR